MRRRSSLQTSEDERTSRLTSGTWRETELSVVPASVNVRLVGKVGNRPPLTLLKVFSSPKAWPRGRIVQAPR